MKIFTCHIIIILLFFSLLTGCFKGRIDINEFSANYGKAWIPDTSYNYGRRLIQLGMPSEDRIVLWYLLSKEEKRMVQENRLLDRISLQVTLNNKRVVEGKVGKDNTTRLRHFPFYEYGTGRVEIIGLEPDKRYYVNIKLFNKDKPVKLEAWTAPKKGLRRSFSFIAFSCFQPYIYKKKEPPEKDEYRFFKESIHIANMMNYRASKRTTEGGKGPSFVLGLGDQIYVDPEPLEKGPYAMLWGLHSEARRYGNSDPSGYFDEVYRRHFAVPPINSVFRQLPSAFMWDDHEIRDGWGSQKDENSRSGMFSLWGDYLWKRHIAAARSAAYAYQFSRNPELGTTAWNSLASNDGRLYYKRIDKIIIPKGRPTDGKELFFRFEWSGVSFFIMDTRSQRNYRQDKVISYGKPDSGQNQMDAVKRWLNSYNNEKNRLFVIGTSVPLTVQRNRAGKFFSRFKWLPTWLTFDYIADDVVDQWSSIPDQRRDLLTIITDHFEKHPTHRLIILSGDVHTSQLIYLSLYDRSQRKKRIFGHEVVSSGLAQKSFTFNRLADAAIKKKKGDKGPNGFSFVQAGVLNSPNFAELFVDQSAKDSPPVVSVVFYPAVYKGRLINLGPKEMDAFMKKNLFTLGYDTNDIPKGIAPKTVLSDEKSWGSPHDKANKWFWPADPNALEW